MWRQLIVAIGANAPWSRGPRVMSIDSTLVDCQTCARVNASTWFGLSILVGLGLPIKVAQPTDMTHAAINSAAPASPCVVPGQSGSHRGVTVCPDCKRGATGRQASPAVGPQTWYATC